MTTLVLLLLAQSGEFATWTDADGVTHAALKGEAPASAKRVVATVSVIDPDARPLVLADGGTRADDTAWWRARLDERRREVRRLRAVAAGAAQDVASSTRRECVTATAKAEVPARAYVVRSRAGPLVVRSLPASNMVSNTSCVQTSASSAQVAVLARARVELDDAERALRDEEREATAAGLPLRDLGSD